MKPVSHVFIHIPIVAKRIGEIEVTIIGRTQVAKDTETLVINISVCIIYLHFPPLNYVLLSIKQQEQ